MSRWTLLAPGFPKRRRQNLLLANQEPGAGPTKRGGCACKMNQNWMEKAWPDSWPKLQRLEASISRHLRLNCRWSPRPHGWLPVLLFQHPSYVDLQEEVESCFASAQPFQTKVTSVHKRAVWWQGVGKDHVLNNVIDPSVQVSDVIPVSKACI